MGSHGLRYIPINFSTPPRPSQDYRPDPLWTAPSANPTWPKAHLPGALALLCGVWFPWIFFTAWLLHFLQPKSCQKTYFQTPLRNILRKMETVKNKFMQTGSCQKIFCEKWKVSKIILWKMETVKISSLVSKHTQNNCQNLFYENWKLSKSKKIGADTR